ncbi:MAG: EcsC family protein [Bacteroidales bacterium]|jgi:hypothetical protein|nr:EcsC family protein [Bacteroidales bacterium]
MAEKPTPSLIRKALDIAYEKALQGLPGLDSAEEMARQYLNQKGSLRDKANSLIRWQVVKAGSSGFITGLGGFATLPVTLPANLVSVLYFQVRMIAAIAYMGGYDLRDDRVKSLVYVCLAGNMAKDILQEAGISAGTRLTSQLIGRISESTIKAINQKTGIVLVTKSGSRGSINLSRLVPVAGGLIGGTFDVVTTRIIGKIALRTFIAEKQD